jgi:hypothetical protein
MDVLPFLFVIRESGHYTSRSLRPKLCLLSKVSTTSTFHHISTVNSQAYGSSQDRIGIDELYTFESEDALEMRCFGLSAHPLTLATPVECLLNRGESGPFADADVLQPLPGE